jgi:hypothetical protein
MNSRKKVVYQGFETPKTSTHENQGLQVIIPRLKGRKC